MGSKAAPEISEAVVWISHWVLFGYFRARQLFWTWTFFQMTVEALTRACIHSSQPRSARGSRTPFSAMKIRSWWFCCLVLRWWLGRRQSWGPGSLQTTAFDMIWYGIFSICEFWVDSYRDTNISKFLVNFGQQDVSTLGLWGGLWWDMVGLCWGDFGFKRHKPNLKRTGLRT